MENSSKKSQNRSNERDDASSVDRISNLPDSVLAYILSFLPLTEDAMRTSILSRRWRFLWTLVPNLYFYYHLHNCGRRGKRSKGRFEQFVYRVLHLNTVQSINKFVLSFGYKSEPLCFSNWVSIAIMRNVRELVVNSAVRLVELPSSLFICGTLEILELTGHLKMNALNFVFLPRLTRLQLVAVQYREDGYVSELISSCPVLEFLNIERVPPDNVTIFTISSSSLKQLHYRAGLYYPEDHRYKIEINTPALECLYLSNCIWPGNDITLGSITSLVRADINVDVYFDDRPAESWFYHSVVKLVKALHYLRFLTLSWETIEALSHDTSCLSEIRFERLTKLTVEAFPGAWTCLQDLLGGAVNLESFSFTKCMLGGADLVPCGRNPKKVPRCLATSLKEISFEGLQGFEDELAMISYILDHGSVLKQMKLHAAISDINSKFQLNQKILMFPRRSPTCQIELY